MTFGYGGNGQFWQYALMGIVMIAFWGFTIWAIFGFNKSDSRDHHHHHYGDARMILDSRFTRGEIDGEEYRRLVDTLAYQKQRVG